MKVDTISFEIAIAKKCLVTRCTIQRMVVAHAIEIALYPNSKCKYDSLPKRIYSNLDIVNKSVRPFLFTLSNNSLYEM